MSLPHIVETASAKLPGAADIGAFSSALIARNSFAEVPQRAYCKKNQYPRMIHFSRNIRICKSMTVDKLDTVGSLMILEVNTLTDECREANDNLEGYRATSRYHPHHPRLSLPLISTLNTRNRLFVSIQQYYCYIEESFRNQISNANH